MSGVEPAVVTALRTVLAGKLGVAADQIEVQARSLTDGTPDANYVALFIPRHVSLDEAAITAAVQEVKDMMWEHPSTPTTLAWEYKD